MICEDLPCGNNPCINGGICQASGNNFTCQCLYPYQGDRCQISKLQDISIINNATFVLFNINKSS